MIKAEVSIPFEGRSVSLAAGILATLFAGCFGSTGWRSLDSLAELQAAFNGDAGKHRVVLLLSPT